MVDQHNGRRSRRGANAPTLTTEMIVEAAIRVADDEGLNAVTMRRVATEVNAGAMTLYSYFASKDLLLDAICDSILGEFCLPKVDADAPIDQVLPAVAHAFLQLIREHPAAGRLLLERVTDSPHALEGGMEQVLARFIAAGLDGPTAVHAYGVMIIYTLGFAQYQSPRTWNQDADEDVRAERVAFYRTLPHDKFETISSNPEAIVALSADHQFSIGITLFASALAAGTY
ncbi:TetR/AcrR family transcriptional regulator [Williamsia sp.]|uniref:TetR/AcrR family transcriptional regulator n=1 Tax=Williamsia sp. TaxID=1872085 RepID=UPI002F952DBB